jgi:hypothetical protein
MRLASGDPTDLANRTMGNASANFAPAFIADKIGQSASTRRNSEMSPRESEDATRRSRREHNRAMSGQS